MELLALFAGVLMAVSCLLQWVGSWFGTVWIWLGYAVVPVLMIANWIHHGIVCAPVSTGPESVQFPCDGPGASLADAVAGLLANAGVLVALVSWPLAVWLTGRQRERLCGHG